MEALATTSPTSAARQMAVRKMVIYSATTGDYTINAITAEGNNMVRPRAHSVNNHGA